MGDLGGIATLLIGISDRIRDDPHDPTLPDVNDPRLSTLKGVLRNFSVDNDPKKKRTHRPCMDLYEQVRTKGGNRTAELVANWLWGPSAETLRKQINARKRLRPQLQLFDYMVTPLTIPKLTAGDRWAHNLLYGGRYGTHVLETRSRHQVPDTEFTLVQNARDNSKCIKRACLIPIPAPYRVPGGSGLQIGGTCSILDHPKKETHCELGRLSDELLKPTHARDFAPFDYMIKFLDNSFVADNIDLVVYQTTSGFRGNNPESFTMQLGNTCLKTDHRDTAHQNELSWYYFSEHIGPKCRAMITNFGRDGAPNFFKEMWAFSQVNPPRWTARRFREMTAYLIPESAAIRHVGRIVPPRPAAKEGEFDIPAHVLQNDAQDPRHNISKWIGLAYADTRNMRVGDYDISSRDWVLVFMMVPPWMHKMKKSVVDRRDPMCKKACQTLINAAVLRSFDKLAETMGGDEAPFMGLVWYIKVIRSFYHAVFSTELTHIERAELALYVVFSVEFWKISIRENGRDNLTRNFITKQTNEHLVMACNTIVITQCAHRDYLPDNPYYPDLDGEDCCESHFSDTAFQNHLRQADIGQFRDSQNTLNNYKFARSESGAAATMDQGRPNSDIKIDKDDPIDNLDGTARSLPRPDWKKRPLDPANGARAWYTKEALNAASENAKKHALLHLKRLGASVSAKAVQEFDMRPKDTYSPPEDSDNEGDSSGDDDDDDNDEGGGGGGGDEEAWNNAGPDSLFMNGDLHHRDPFADTAGASVEPAVEKPDPNPRANLDQVDPLDDLDPDPEPEPEPEPDTEPDPKPDADEPAYNMAPDYVLVPDPTNPEGPGIKVHRRSVIALQAEGGHTNADRLLRHQNRKPRKTSLFSVIESAPNDNCVKLFSAAFVAEHHDPSYAPKPSKGSKRKSGTKGKKAPPKHDVCVAVLRGAWWHNGRKTSQYGYIQPGNCDQMSTTFSYCSTVAEDAERDSVTGKWPADLVALDLDGDASKIRLTMRKQLPCDLKKIDLEGTNMLPILCPVALQDSGLGYYTLKPADLAKVKKYMRSSNRDADASAQLLTPAAGE